jgi:hypothetical protein
VLEPVHGVRPAAGVWPSAQHAGQPRIGHVHSVAGPAQLGRQPAHLLLLLDADLSHPQVSSFYFKPQLILYNWTPSNALTFPLPPPASFDSPCSR